MYGFRINIGVNAPWNLQEDKNSFIRYWNEDSILIAQWTLRKFEQDKLWMDSHDFFIASEGILFNRPQIAQNPLLPITDWRGSFACVRVNKVQKEIEIYNDQIGSHMLFWCKSDQGIFVSSDLFDLARVSGFTSPNEEFMHRILNYGYGDDEQTFIHGIKRIGAGKKIKVKNGEVTEENYYTFSNKPLFLSLNEQTQRIDFLFRQSIQRVLDKNAEYNLPNIFPLSGGLDSRMVQIVARELTNRPIHNFTYSQSKHYDHILPQQISEYLGNSWQFIPLDGGDYLKKIDAITHATQALVNYNGPSESYYSGTQIDLYKAGVILTGVNGDNIFSVETNHKHELERLYALSFAGNGLGSPLIYQQHTETYSPFCDVDVLEFALRIPTRLRWNYKFYDQWILRYYPEATKWDHKGELIGHRRIRLFITGRNIVLRDLPKRILAYAIKHLTGYSLYREEEGHSMNPYDTWLKNNSSLRSTLQDYYVTHKTLLAPYPKLYKKAEEIWQKHPLYEQCAVLTILSALYQFKTCTRS